MFVQPIQTGLGLMGFKASVRDLSSFQDDYGLKVGDDEEDEDDDDDDEEDGEEGDNDDEDDEDDEEDDHDKDK